MALREKGFGQLLVQDHLDGSVVTVEQDRDQVFTALDPPTTLPRGW